MPSTAERHWSGSSTVIRLNRTARAVSSMTRMAGFADPRDLVTAIQRIVYVSVESTRIIEGLPSQITDDRENRNIR